MTSYRAYFRALSFILAGAASTAILAAPRVARADESTFETSIQVLAGYTRTLTDGDGADLLHFGVAARLRPLGSHFSFDVMYVHHQALVSDAVQIEQASAGVGYEFWVRELTVRPSVRFAFLYPHQSGADQDTYSTAVISGLAYGPALTLSFPRKSTWYGFVDGSALYQGSASTDDTTGDNVAGWTFTLSGGLGARFEL
jgi:hypothetical protein